MRLGWLVDQGGTVGGAELTQNEFRFAAPDGVEIVDCRPGEVDYSCDLFVIHNCVTYTREDLQGIDAPAVKYWHDVGPHLQSGVREWLDKHAVSVCCSPVQADYMGIAAKCIPPPVDLERFRHAAASVNGSRNGAVCVGSWRNYGKAPHRAAEWAKGNGGVDFYGEGLFAPPSAKPVPYEQMPALLASYKTFVFLPIVIEPFGRLIAEAWAAGCEVVTNNLVGARWWIENDPDALETAGDDFWKVVTA